MRNSSADANRCNDLAALARGVRDAGAVCRANLHLYCGELRAAVRQAGLPAGHRGIPQLHGVDVQHRADAIQQNAVGAVQALSFVDLT